MALVTAVQTRENFKLWLRFDDGVEGVIDLSDLVGRGVFARWRDTGSFGTAHVDEFGAVAWEGDVELCPDSLYERMTGRLPFPVRAANSKNANA